MKVDPAHITQLVEKMHIVYAQEPYMVRKVRTTVNINEDLKKLADEFGINLSAFLELKLFEHFRELILMRENRSMVLRPGFEPGSRDRESRMIGRATPPELDVGRRNVFISLSL